MSTSKDTCETVNSLLAKGMEDDTLEFKAYQSMNAATISGLAKTVAA